MTLQIKSIKPNPTGKDRNRSGQVSSVQLAGEWADFQNVGTTPVDLSPINLWHRTYRPGQAPDWEKVLSLSGSLQPGKTVRVHSGSGPEGVLRDQDRRGADHHLFTGKSYVWNNQEGDTPTLHNKVTKVTLDSASYDPNPPEGDVLVRIGDKLVSAKMPSYSYR